MALLSDVETACVSAPSTQKFGPAGAAYAVRARIAEGQSFAASRDYVVSLPRHRHALEEARINGFTVAGAAFGPAEFAALTGP